VAPGDGFQLLLRSIQEFLQHRISSLRKQFDLTVGHAHYNRHAFARASELQHIQQLELDYLLVVLDLNHPSLRHSQEHEPAEFGTVHESQFVRGRCIVTHLPVPKGANDRSTFFL
jgi:hypothetical protein